MTAQFRCADLPTIDTDAIGTFCDVVFGYLDGLVPIRALSESGTPSHKPHVEFPPTSQVAERLVRIAPRAAETLRGLYVVPGTVLSEGSAKAQDIVQSGVLLVDLDTGDIDAARAHLVLHLGQPTLEVASGGVTEAGQTKQHLFWRLTEPAEGEDLARVAVLRGKIATKVGGDGSFASIHQPIRVAGTIHGKNAKRSPVRLLAHYPVEYDLADLSDAVSAMPPLVSQVSADTHGQKHKGGPSAGELATQKVRAGGQDGITRFDALSRVMGHWLRNVRAGRCSVEDALQAVLEHNTTMIVPPWEDPRVRREFDALLHHDVEKNGPLSGRSRTDAVTDGDLSGRDPPRNSDDALALTFVGRHGKETRHIPAWGSWYIWTGQVWERDEIESVRERMRHVCRAAAATEDSPTAARRIASDKTIGAALRVAGSDPRIATRAADWDAHPMLLNTPAGVIDLRTGEVAHHDQGLLLTQITSAAPGKECPLWLGFLATVTGGDRELQEYLQRLAGYCLTGTTSEQVFVFLHGVGANGKSVFLRTIAHILGSYAATATLDTFMASRSDRHLTELAGLRAARLVTVPETEAGRSWSEARIKMVTGGENIRANFMRCDHFEFRPQFKLVVMGNHRPAITSVGESMRRRLHLVPFSVTIPEDERDESLYEKLAEERDGILGWMLAGCAMWQRMGLKPPASVVAAAEDYFASEDLVGQWIAECCAEQPDAWTASTRLFASWKGWAESNGHAVGSSKSLGEALRGRGLSTAKSRGVRGWHGIGLARPTAAAESAA